MPVAECTWTPVDGTDLSCVMDADHCVAYAVCLADHSLSLVPSDGPGDDAGRAEEVTVMHTAHPLAVVWSGGGLELASLMHSTSHFAKPARDHSFGQAAAYYSSCI